MGGDTDEGIAEAFTPIQWPQTQTWTSAHAAQSQRYKSVDNAIQPTAKFKSQDATYVSQNQDYFNIFFKEM